MRRPVVESCNRSERALAHDLGFGSPDAAIDLSCYWSWVVLSEAW